MAEALDQDLTLLLRRAAELAPALQEALEAQDLSLLSELDQEVRQLCGSLTLSLQRADAESLDEAQVLLPALHQTHGAVLDALQAEREELQAELSRMTQAHKGASAYIDGGLSG
jgi:DNA repair exonuclease SbcCD ATPase subunit